MRSGALERHARFRSGDEPVVQPVTERGGSLPHRTEPVVRLNGAVQVVAGLLLGSGRLPAAAVGGVRARPAR
ncbi:hypothetical protein [Streptomyces sp. NPDC001401]|uniref:hypothetical protein n=1 Tax=Streptomyces sp. NPDC001401 TaxID=3364570 RepID=UPI003697FA0A